MRILHTLHDYLPDQVAGVEVYTNRLAHRQAVETDNTVAILFATIDPARPTGSYKVAREGDVDLFPVVQNRDWRRFEQTWRDSRLTSALEAIFDDFRPELVHVQHLMNIGLPLVELAREREVPLVMTLHDQWWACAAGGQRFRADRQRCDDLVAARCARCTSTLVGPALSIRGRRQRGHAVSKAELKAASSGASGTPRQPEGPERRVGPLNGIASLATAAARFSWTGAVSIGGRARIESRWRVMRGLAESVDRFIAPSDEILEAAVEFGFPRGRIIRLSHGFPSPRVVGQPLPERLGRFGYVGSLVPHKGVHELVRAFNAMPENVSLDVYGSPVDAPSYFAELKSLAVHTGICFHGERPPAEIPAILANLDCLVAPSIWKENAPLNVQEAFLSGRPVVASDLGGHRELLAGGGGLLYPPGDEVALAAALRRLVEEPGLGLRLAASVPPVGTLDEHVGRLDGIYRGVVEGSKPVVFLDRDGVINEDSPNHIRSVEEWKPIPGSLSAIARLSRAGYRIVVVSNQSGIARSLFGLDDLEEIHDALRRGVDERGGRVDGVLFCPHGPDDGCPCRKPRAGLIEQARRELAVDSVGAPFVGDRETDLQAARAAGCRPVFVRSGMNQESELGPEWAEVQRFADLAEVVDALLAGKGLGEGGTGCGAEFPSESRAVTAAEK